MSHSEHTLGKVSDREGLGVFRLGMIWAGFPFILAITITGSVFVIKSDLATAISAIVIGSLIMFVYVGLLGEIGWKEKRSFSQIAEIIFGRSGYVAIAGLLSFLVLGWFTINTAMPAEIFAASFHVPYWIVAAVLGIIFVIVTARGIYGMNLISNLSIPAYAALMIVSFVVLASHSGSTASGGMEEVGSRALDFSEILAGVLASFADSGTLAPDFNRWAVDRRTSWLSVFSAFPLGFGVAMLAGVAFTALLALRGIGFDEPFQTGNPVGYLIGSGGLLLTFAVVVAVTNQGSNATHCLYNSVLGFSKLSGKRYLVTTLSVGVVGVIIAVTGVWSLLLDWLKIIGVLVPPIGAVVILAYYGGFYERRRDDAMMGMLWMPWIALSAGWVCGLVVNFTSAASYIPVPLSSFASAFIVMGTFLKVTPYKDYNTRVVFEEE
ncbi:cytosine permease [Acidithiobacillus sp.]|uniref:purine-cytosine permease family protein n=1 Tax=Acidithiobacillus sp. TaxID=1872118 RepID=UPI0032AF47D4